MNRLAKRSLFAAMAIVTLATVGIAFISFARKVDSFSSAGFTYDREGGALLLRSVEPESAAARAGLEAGRPDHHRGRPDRRLAGAPRAAARAQALPAPAGRDHGGEVRGVSLGEPSVRFDITYIFLAFVGFLYLVIGLFTIARERTGVARVFWALCLASFARLRPDARGTARRAVEGGVARRGRLPGVPAGAAPPLLPGFPAADPRAAR